MFDLDEFLVPVNVPLISGDEAFNDSQMGRIMTIYKDEFPDISQADIVLAGINEFRGEGFVAEKNAADAVRAKFYKLHYWHKEIKIADIGNIQCGANLQDSYSAVETVLKELLDAGKTVIILGGSHDITLAQYYAYAERNKFIEATVIDAHIDLHSENSMRSENFLMDMLTSEPNHVRHYNHIGFQSYFVHPHMLETMDKLRFDCFRVGTAREKLDEMEPVLRNSDMVSFDLSAIKYADAPAAAKSPNGFTGEDACTLTRFAGMSHSLSSLGIYGYDAAEDEYGMSAMQIAQMLWYFIDGKSRGRQESDFSSRHHFNEYHTAFAETEILFIQSKNTGRWWMQLSGDKMVPCSYNDYLTASNNEIPERWLRFQERE